MAAEPRMAEIEEASSMGFYHNMKLKTKLIAGFMIVALLSLVVGIIGLTSINQLITIGEVFAKTHSRGLTLLNEISDGYGRANMWIRDVALMQDRAKTHEIVVKILERAEEVDTHILELKDLTGQADPILDGLADNLMAALVVYRSHVEGAMQLFEVGQYDEGKAMIYNEDSVASEATVKEMLDELNARGAVVVSMTGVEQDAIANRSIVLMLVAAGAALIIGAMIGLFLSQSTAKSIKQIGLAIDEVADGDFTALLDINNESDLGLLAKSFNSMVERLRDVLDKVNSTTHIVDDASKQVSSSSMSLAQISTEQASSVEEISASMSEITMQTKANAENASKATDLSSKTRDNAIRGNDMMSEMLSAMQAINDTSNNISSIIKVIDDIAFQTNILALNAAVEAARAGQHGRGFAVVAEEVRNLAARSQKAASETTHMIEGAIKEVARGTQIANETAAALNEIVEGVSESASLVSEISDASEQQSQGASQISVGMEQVSQAIQTTSSVAQEAASSSSELSDQANTLKELISMFKFEGGKTGGSRQPKLPGDGGHKAARPRIPAVTGAPAPARVQPKDGDGVPELSLGTGDFGKY